MTARRCTVVSGIVSIAEEKSVCLRLDQKYWDSINRTVLWIPRRSIEGGAALRAGDRDPAVSNWWIAKRLFKGAFVCADYKDLKS